MARLPQPGADKGTWGEILNEYLSASHDTDGSLKSGISADKLQDGTTNKVLTAADKAKLSTLTTDLGAKSSLSVGGVFQPTYNIDSTPVQPGDIGAYTKAEVNALIANLSSIPGDSLWRNGRIETFGRMNLITESAVSGVVWLSHFVALDTITIDRLVMSTGGTTPSGVTLLRMALYTESADLTLTKVAQTDNSAGGTATYSTVARTLSTVGGFPNTYQLVKGQRYAIGFIQIATTPCAITTANVTNQNSLPRIGTWIGSQTDLANSYSAATISANAHWSAMYLWGQLGA